MENASLLVIIVSCLLGLSEGLSLIPSVKANGIFNIIVMVLKALAPKNEEK